MTSDRGDRVDDWSTDYDVTDRGFQTDPYPIWDELRGTCPVAHTERLGGSYLPTTWDDIVAVAYDTDNFSSRDVGVLVDRFGQFTLEEDVPVVWAGTQIRGPRALPVRLRPVPNTSAGPSHRQRVQRPRRRVSLRR